MSNETKWPFSAMKVGERCSIDDKKRGPRGQSYVHVYARSSGKKFKTWTEVGAVYFERVE